MIGLGSSLTSGVPESKYSGVFDGQNDFINCGPSTSVIANGASEASVMFWIKTTTSETNRYIFSIKRGSSSSAFSCIISSNKAGSIIHTGSGVHTNPTSTTSINDGTWHHVAITGKASLQKIYVDGTLEDTHEDTFDMDTSTDTFMIGDHDSSKFMEMTLSNLAVFNTELDLNNVQAAYNGGGDFNLTFNQGNYNSSSNLTAYYKMGNGSFDDKANGIVHDQDNPGFGADVVTDGDFPSLSNWNQVNETGANQVTLEGGKVKLTYDNTVATSALGINQTNVFVTGGVYQLKIDVESISGDGIKFFSGSTVHETGVGTGSHTFYFTAAGTTLAIYRSTQGSASVSTIDNVVIKRLNGNPGVTSGGVTFSSDTP